MGLVGVMMGFAVALCVKYWKVIVDYMKYIDKVYILMLAYSNLHILLLYYTEVVLKIF